MRLFPALLFPRHLPLLLVYPLLLLLLHHFLLLLGLLLLLLPVRASCCLRRFTCICCSRLGGRLLLRRLLLLFVLPVLLPLGFPVQLALLQQLLAVRRQRTSGHIVVLLRPLVSVGLLSLCWHFAGSSKNLGGRRQLVCL